MKRIFTVVATNQWKTGNIELIKIGSHVCDYCDMLHLSLLGFSIKIGMATYEE